MLLAKSLKGPEFNKILSEEIGEHKVLCVLSLSQELDYSFFVFFVA